MKIDLDNLPPEMSEHDRDVIRKAAAHNHLIHEENDRLQPLGITAVPTEQLAEIYRALKTLIRLGQHTLDEWDKLSPEMRELKGKIFMNSDFPACYAGQWLPKELRTQIHEECRMGRRPADGS
jgi:hypothetical protein